MGKRLLAVMAVLISIAALGLVSGCGDDDEDTDVAATTAPEETTATEPAGGAGGGAATSVEMTEYEFIPNDLTVSSGDSLSLENTGEIPHNLTIVEGEPEAGGTELAASDDFPGGESGEMTVDAEPGEYGILCTIPGHAEQGMTGTITVE
jgi:plastocyanin